MRWQLQRQRITRNNGPGADPRTERGFAAGSLDISELVLFRLREAANGTGTLGGDFQGRESGGTSPPPTAVPMAIAHSNLVNGCSDLVAGTRLE